MIGLMLATLIAWPFCACCHAGNAEAPSEQCCCGFEALPGDQTSEPETPRPHDEPCAHCEGDPEGLSKTIRLALPAESGQIAPPPPATEVPRLHAKVDLPETAPNPPPPDRQLLGALLCVFRL